jgi:hypothetical protein
MKYSVFIQNKFSLTVEAQNTGEALKIVGLKINNGEVVFDPNEPKNIRLEPVNE